MLAADFAVRNHIAGLLKLARQWSFAYRLFLP